MTNSLKQEDPSHRTHSIYLHLHCSKSYAKIFSELKIEYSIANMLFEGAQHEYITFTERERIFDFAKRRF